MNKKNVQNSALTNRGKELPLVVILGPTASGKSATALRIAKEFSGEIICADSRTVYKYMNIGTTKPSIDDQSTVPHWGLDLVEPGEHFSAADFKHYALKKIAEIRDRGNIPMLVGGSGLYIDGVIFDYEFGKPNEKLRQELEALSLDELKNYCANNNIKLPENHKNRRYVIRAIEQKNINSKRLMEPIAHTIVVGITTKSEQLRHRIHERSEQLFENGMVEEAKKLGKMYGWDSEAMTGNIYKLVKQFLDGELTESELKAKNEIADWRLAKRQLTWFKRNPFIHWVTLDDAYLFIKKQLAASTESE
jgi:tRNA dimethylallyltransferase